ncbi:imidazole glycerol phosphate synthase subunit HisF [Candidatus Marinamargulisbacteria bacterium SCGC AG-439-L15]|nr:imidazole glycerol phosphate synthase subunit HisF [Candidatus Marinamargulisbacteria bacterium SCGC AG-439-L15]
MLSKRLIPCLDVTNGRVVKGTQFVDLRDAGDAIELAKKYNAEGADELVFLDITASSDKRYILKDLVQKTANEIFIPFTVGGGINDIETIRDILDAGADKVSINTAAVKNPSLIKESSQLFGNQCIVVAIDAKRVSAPSNKQTAIEEVRIDETSQWEVYTHGGRHPTGIDVIKWAVYMAHMGAGELLLTSMDADGTKAGYDLDLTEGVSKAVDIPIIASGGAGQVNHISEVLKVSDAALLASLLHFGELSISEIKTHCKNAKLPIR